MSDTDRFPPSFPASFLVVAHSARLLAQSASRGRHPVRTLDLFDDDDTRGYALSGEAVAARAGGAGGFDRDDLLRRAARLCPPSRCLGLVYGAGFEDDTATLEQLARGRELLGNAPALVSRLKDPATFFGLLERLGIDHPATVLQRPGRPAGWLVKRRGATGGAHVLDAAGTLGAAAGADAYFQRRAPGRSLSALFLADGRRARIVGISRQLRRGRGSRRYAYAGAVGPVEVPAAAWRTLDDALQALVERTGLVGSNSLDFMLEGARPAVLEINPRPSATIDLYDADWPRGLFDAHVQACRGHLPAPSRMPASSAVRAHRLVHADAGLRIADSAAFEAWCSDLPRPGSRIAAGAPVCTVHASGRDVPAALRRLARRRRRIESRIVLQLESEQTDELEERAPERESECRPAGGVVAGAPPGAQARRAAA